MKLMQIFYLVTAVGVGFLGTFVLTRNAASGLNRSLARFAVALTIWLFGSFMALFDQTAEVATLWYRVSYTGIVFIPSSVYDFAAHLLGSAQRLVKWLCYFFSVLFAALIWTGGSFISGVHLFVWGYYPAAGPFHAFFLAGFGCVFGWTYFILLSWYFRNRKRMASDIQLKRVIYVFWALLVGNFASLDFLPNYGFGLTPSGFVFMTAMLAIFAYAILAYQLLEIEVVIRRTAVFAGLFAFVYGIFTIATLVGQEFFKGAFHGNQWLALIPAVIIITFALRPLETFLTDVTDRFLFQKEYDYRELLKMFTNEILTVIDLQKITEETVANLQKIMKLESASIILLDKNSKTYKTVASSGVNEKNLVFQEKDILIHFLKETHQPILKDRSVDHIEGDGVMKQTFRQLNAQVCMPLLLHENMIGFLSLGMKKSGEDYTHEDLDILNTLARTEAIAISNAELFDELSKTQAEAAQREKMAVIGTLAAGINHEICNPLGIVRGQCEMFLLNLRDGFYEGKSSEEITRISTEIMQKVIRETDRATAITKKLSSFAKPSRRSDLDDVSIEKEVDEVLSLVEHDLNVNNIAIHKDFPPDFPHIMADRKQIQEVLFNLIRNSAQAIDKKQGEILISGFQDGHSAVIRISDNGAGIPAGKIGQIFNPFYTTKAPGKGTGLGLFIVKQVVERNKGSITVESREGIGTTFTLRFPSFLSAMAV